MSVTYNYDLTTDFPNGIDSVQLTDEIATAGLTGLETINTDVVADTCDIVFAASINETTLDAVVAAHDPVDCTCEPEYFSSESQSNTTEETWQTKLTDSVDVMAGGWLVRWSAEVVCGDNDSMQVRLMNGSEVALHECNAGSGVWQSVGGIYYASFTQGETMTLSIDYKRVGSTGDTVSIKRARVFVEKVL
jgi:hypothetical protein